MTADSLRKQLAEAQATIARLTLERDLALSRAQAIRAMAADLTKAIGRAEDLLETGARTVRTNTDHAIACVVLRLTGADHDYLELAGASHLVDDSEVRAAFRLPLHLDDTPIRVVVDNAQSLLVPGMTRDRALAVLSPRFRTLVEHYGFGGAAYAPITVEHEVYGMLVIYGADGVPLNEDDLTFLEQAADILGLSISAARSLPDQTG